MKILAMYLPQFHRTPENDEWWGKGFTEWTTVRGAKPLFPNHDQPRVPDEYYNLLDKKTMERQARMMNEYRVDGMCFYHYYFENGRKILEKPAENLLKWKEIDMPFCFYWANESWVRTWSNLQNANAWVDTLNKNEKREGDGVLLRQEYGNKEQWKAHFHYLLPFFKDNRYIKKNGRPLFIIYKPENMTCLTEMTGYWNKLMEEEGLPHIYFIGKNTYAESLDGYLDHEPQFALRELCEEQYGNEYGIKQLVNYDDVWNKIIRNQKVGKNYFYGGFVGFDDSPRHGKRAIIIYGQTPEKFRKYMICLLAKAYRADCDFVFLNAWNEWGEGMYLEPDKKHGTAYLQALKEARLFVEKNADVLSQLLDSTTMGDESGEEEKNRGLLLKNERYRDYWITLRDWLNIIEDGKTITAYLRDNNIHRVAIYGMGMLGTPLYEELVSHNFEVIYGIDQDSRKDEKFDIPICSLDDKLQNVELIIVTVGYAYENIKNRILKQGNFNIMSLNELIAYGLN